MYETVAGVFGLVIGSIIGFLACMVLIDKRR